MLIELRHQLKDQPMDQLHDYLYYRVGVGLYDQIYNQFWDHLWNQIEDQLWGQLDDQLREDLG